MVVVRHRAGWDDASVTDFAGEWRAWHAAREQGLRDPRGWLAVTAIHWLTTAPQVFDDVPGTWCGGDQLATVTLGHGETLTAEGSLLTEGLHDLGPLDESGLTVTFDNANAQVADRGGTVIVRPRHPDSPNLRAYRGTPCFPPDARWAIPASFEPYAAGENALPEVTEEEPVGEVVFECDGAEHRLIAWGEEDGSLWILFRDATSGVTTYPANRQLLTRPPSPDGTLRLDFNRAINMPCAYTDFATCPLPPPENTLPFAVEAGEKLPVMHAE
jgi:uncharacterized protein